MLLWIGRAPRILCRFTEYCQPTYQRQPCSGWVTTLIYRAFGMRQHPVRAFLVGSMLLVIGSGVGALFQLLNPFYVLVIVVWSGFGLIGVGVVGRFRFRSPIVPRAPQPETPRASRTSLSIRFLPEPPYRYQRQGYPEVYWRIGVHNAPAGPTAEGVVVEMVDIRPRPRSAMFRADFPYHIPTMDNPLDLISRTTIAAGEEIRFELARTWLSGEGRWIVGYFDRKAEDLPRRADWSIAFEADEHWLIHYRVSCHNAETVNFKMVVTLGGNGPQFELA